MSKAKFAEPILQTIDQLRSRKARPDLGRICHMVERRHGIAADGVQSSLAIMVAENLVVKVNYKGSVSYRNPAKWKRRKRDPAESAAERKTVAVLRAKLPKKKLLKLKAVKALVQTKRKRGRPPLKKKAKAKPIVEADEDTEEEVLDESLVGNDDTASVAATPKPSEAGSHKKEKSDSESVPDASSDETTSSRSSKPGVGRPKSCIRYKLVKGRKSDGKAASSSTGSSKASGSEGNPPGTSENVFLNGVASDDVEDEKSESTSKLVSSAKIKLIMSAQKLESRRLPGRSRKSLPESRRLPGRSRKSLKFKKSISQDSESYPPVKKARHDVGEKADTKANSLASEKDDKDPKCDFCLGTSASNRNGQPEELLICKDCQANKAHPSCMDYSDELARRACRSPWQCIDCKTCNICNDSGDPDAMLFCDACDKGYHMSCHQPPIVDIPLSTGKWVCCQCVLELGGDGNQTDTGEAEEGEHGEVNNDLPMEEIIPAADGGGASCLPTPNDSPVHFSEETDGNKLSSELSPSVVVPLARLATTLTAEVPDASIWSIVDVVNFFADMGFVEQAEAFREQEIDGRALLLMTRMDVLTGLSLKLGPALKIYVHIQRLQAKHLNSH